MFYSILYLSRHIVLSHMAQKYHKKGVFVCKTESLHTYIEERGENRHGPQATSATLHTCGFMP